MPHSFKSLSKQKGSKLCHKRNRCGFSMLSMAMLTILVIITITATGAALIPYYRSNSTDTVSEIQARAIAESAINYTLALLNDPDTRANVDVSTTTPEFRIIDIPPVDLNLPTQVALNTRSIKVIVRNDTPIYQSAVPTKLFPLSYDSQLVSGNSNAKFSTNYWRTFTALVEYGQNGFVGPYRAGIKATIKPGLLTASTGSTGATPDSAFFTGAVSARDSVVLEDNTSTSSSSNPHNGNIKAGGTIEIGDNALVDGYLQSISTSQVNITASSSATLDNQVQYLTSPPTINSAPIGSNPGDPLNQLQQGPYLQAQSTKTAPLGSTNIELIPPALSPTPTTPNFPSDGGASSTGLSGDYVIDSSQLADPSQLNSIGQPQSTIRLFIQNTGDISDPLNISLNSLGNPSTPSNLEIWYNGERPINFTGTNVSALIYAPYTTVTIGDGNKQTNFSGAVVGGKVVVKSKSSVDFFNNASSSMFSSSDFTFNATSKTNANTIRWQLQTYKELHTPEFLAEKVLAP